MDGGDPDLHAEADEVVRFPWHSLFHLDANYQGEQHVTGHEEVNDTGNFLPTDIEQAMASIEAEVNNDNYDQQMSSMPSGEGATPYNLHSIFSYSAEDSPKQSSPRKLTVKVPKINMGQLKGNSTAVLAKQDEKLLSQLVFEIEKVIELRNNNS